MMVVEKEDHLGLSLSLSLSLSQQQHKKKLNLMPFHIPNSSSASSASSSSYSHMHVLHKPTWSQTLFYSSSNNNSSSSAVTIANANATVTPDRSSENCRGEATRSFLRGVIDVNVVPPATADFGGENEAGVSSPNSTVSSVSGKRSERSSDLIVAGEENDNDNDQERISDEDDAETSRKKLRLSKDQSAILEESFKEHNTLNPKQKLALAKQLGLRARQVEVWFQNRRARTKLKQTEVDCEFLKRCCENLTEENRRLQKEVQELRALKLSPQFYMQMTPPTTLTMCPSCERVGVPPAEPRAHHPRLAWAAPSPPIHRPRP